MRLYLAVAVLFWHSPPGALRWLPFSFTAVICFFIVSGFYISKVLNESYRDETARFYLNRAVRLYPVYLVALAAVWIASAFDVPGILIQITSQPLWETVGQALIFPRTFWDTLALSPGPQAAPAIRNAIGPIYTVGLEMLFYAVAPLFVRRSLPVLLLIFGIGLGAHFAPVWLELPARQWQYEFLPGILVFFTSGSLSYRLYLVARRWSFSRWMGYAALPTIILFVWVIDQGVSPVYVNDLRVYVLYGLVAFGLPFLFIATKDWKKDRFLGALSYPLYVVHLPIVDVIGASNLADIEWLARGVAIVVALVLTVCIELPLERVRGGIRPRNDSHEKGDGTDQLDLPT